MATRELRKKRGVLQGSAKKTDSKESKVPHEGSHMSTSPDDILDENTKDTGQEKDAETHFDKKKGGGVMDSPGYSRSKERTRERSSSPFSRNVVEPLSSTTPFLGSTVSLRSDTSTKSKEAWPERQGSTSSVKSKTGSIFSAKSRPPSANKDPTETQIETVSIKDGEPVQNAYIPYTHARNYIARITGDFASMQEKHLHVVRDITLTYKAIEDETQAQFNVFVLTLRKQFSGKLATFKQVVELYSTQHARKEQYWKDTVESLTERINKMLKDRKILLINNREEIEKLENEKAQLLVQLTGRMDQEKSAATHASKTLENKIQELEEENKTVRAELDTEKEEVQRLKALGIGVAVVAAATSEETKKEKASVEKSAPATYSSVEDERQKLSDERHQMVEDVGRMVKERQELMEKVKQLQSDVTRLSLGSGELQEKYRLMLLRLGEADRVREQYAKLESQYNALAMVIGASPGTSQAAKEKEAQVEKERAMMEEERQRLAKEIERWEKEFKKKNKREPTEDDKSDSAKELYASMGEAKYMVDKLDSQKETLQAVQSGTAPSAPELSPAIGAVLEPEVSVVEVKVPDPDIVIQLEKSQATADELSSRVAALQEENSHLKSLLAGVKEKTPAVPVVMREDTEKIGKLTNELGEKSDELEGLRAKNREMRKDIKKMMRQHAKLQAKMEDMDPDLPKLLEMVAVVVQSIHGEHEHAGRAVKKRLQTATEAVKPLSEKEAAARKAANAWDKNYKKTHGAAPDETSRDDEGRNLKAAADEAGKALEIKQLEVRALTLLTTGIYNPQDQSRLKSVLSDTDVEQQLTSLDSKVIDLEAEKDRLQEENTSLQKSLQDLEEQLESQAAAGASAVVGDSEDAAKLEREIDSLNAALQQEKAAHDATREELESLQKQLQTAKEELSELQGQSQSRVLKVTSALEASLASKNEQLTELRKRNEEMEKARLANVPVDTAKEIKNLQNKIAMLEREKEEMKVAGATQAANIVEAKGQLDLVNKTLGVQRAANRELEGSLKAARAEKEKSAKELTNQLDKKEQQRAAAETKLKLLESSAVRVKGKTAAAHSSSAGKGGASTEETAALKREIKDLTTRIKQLETEARQGPVAGDAVAADKNVQKRHEKILKELERRLELEVNKSSKLSDAQMQKDEELKVLNKDVRDKDAEIAKLKAELARLGVAAKEGVEAAEKAKELETENKKLAEDNKVLTESFNSERVLRKKYYNMVEDMKGKIRVYCRARPLSSSEMQRGNFSVVKSPDEYSVAVATAQRGVKEFEFDQVFMENSTQEKIFEDTNNLIQSAVDGYNVCIFAYGQTGSGKTFTMIGDQAGNYPGITPRAFRRIFEMAEENKGKFRMTVTAYMLELYNDKLIDLFARPDTFDEDKLEIKKDKKGMVFIHGAMVKPASNAKELNALFEAGSKNRHTAATKMNAESSRSHLVIGIVLESTSRSTGNVVRGKLSLVDLAGSERVGKTGASAETLKEAMSINKSLSALGDVISALSSEQQFIPYRNSKLTMLMQDSLGGNAKTLMFVNISPADYNADETVVSLMYASRVKLITNDASKNADNKEIARLKAVIAKLKGEEKVEEEEEV